MSSDISHTFLKYCPGPLGMSLLGNMGTYATSTYPTVLKPAPVMVRAVPPPVPPRVGNTLVIAASSVASY